MLDWDSDPELKRIRDEFIESLAERRDLLARELAALPAAQGADYRARLEAIQGIAHKIAGTAASYGFPSLTRVGEVIDDFLDLSLAENAKAPLPDAARAGELGSLLATLLESALSTRKDDPSLLQDPGAARVISGAESALAAATS